MRKYINNKVYSFAIWLLAKAAIQRTKFAIAEGVFPGNPRFADAVYSTLEGETFEELSEVAATMLEVE